MPTPIRQQKINRVIEARQQGVVVFENVWDPHNAAACLRSMDGFGFQTAYFVFETITPYNPKKVGKESSSSANKWIDCKCFKTTADCVRELKKDGYTIYATTLKNANTINLYSKLPDLGPKIAIVFGNEHLGISDEMVRVTDHLLHVPMLGFVESFNISVFCALTLAEVSRQRHQSGMSTFSLTDEQKVQLQQNWS